MELNATILNYPTRKVRVRIPAQYQPFRDARTALHAGKFIPVIACLRNEMIDAFLHAIRIQSLLINLRGLTCS
ncbi:hypothetical protein [Pedobacter sp. Leaf176]|uniref:hypothetical protein n=1 Tax=Pedobacter sp. Leaf176 TaxID=1736286 RepID=UPI000ABD1A7F|nr:hypothetical protein [Pedobacter sp. Leaf176]